MTDRTRPPKTCDALASPHMGGPGLAHVQAIRMADGVEIDLRAHIEMLVDDGVSIEHATAAVALAAGQFCARHLGDMIPDTDEGPDDDTTEIQEADQEADQETHPEGWESEPF